MKIVLVNTSEKRGGAAIACNRLGAALQASGHDISMVVRDRCSDREDVISVNRSLVASKINLMRFAWERFVIFFRNGFSRKNLFAVSIANTGTDISRLQAVQEADVIHLHWINQGFLSLKDIRKLLSLGKPVVWTMHDMWPFTGICHHARECHLFESSCSNCPFLKYPGNRDLSYSTFFKKKKLALHQISYVGCSEWLANHARNSTLLRNSVIRSIPNPINTGFWKKEERLPARKYFQLPENKKLILFAAVNVSDKRKGIDYLLDGLSCLHVKYPDLHSEVAVVVMGQWNNTDDRNIPFDVYPTGYLTSDEEIRKVYSSVDLFVTPSLEENLPNTVMEAMSCSLPCVGFKVGGIPEMIDHLETGYVADYKSAGDLAAGIYCVLFDSDSAGMGKKARQKVERDYSESVVVSQYEDLYKNIL